MKQTCPYCGNNPVPHWLYWYQESLNVVLTPLRLALTQNAPVRFIKTRRWYKKIPWYLLALAETLKIISRQNDANKCKVRRAQVLWEEGQKRGIVMSELLLFGRPIDVYVAEGGNPESRILNPSRLKVKDKRLRIIFSGLPRPAGYSNKWTELMDDKILLKQKLQSNNLPVPGGGVAASFGGALKNFKSISKPVIVKPRAGSRGRHTATYIYSESDLRQAVKIAKQLCHWVIVEEQLFGPVYRATVINGYLAGVLRGDPPQITGDGRKSILELISEKNSLPHPEVKDIAPDESMEIFLSRQSLSLSSILESGRAVNLTEKIGVNYGGSSSEDFEICHPDNKELFLKAAEAVGDPVVGFDFIIPDITQSWQNQKCGFIEANSLPFINLHHDPLLGTPRNVAALVWDMMGGELKISEKQKLAKMTAVIYHSNICQDDTELCQMNYYRP